MTSRIGGYIARRCTKCSGTIPKGGRCKTGCGTKHLSYQVLLSVTTNGKRKRTSHGTFTRMTDAQAELEGRITEARNGDSVEPSDITVAQHLTRWVERGTISLKESTRTGYRSVVDARLNPAIGSIALQQLSVDDIDGLVEELSGEVAPRTVRNIVRVLQVALGDAQKRGHVRMNVATGVTLPRVVPKPKTTWTPEQVRAFLSSCSGNRLEAALIVLAKTGARRGEVLGMTWRDLDLDTGHWTISQSVTRGTNGPTIDTPKTGASVRRLRLDTMTVASLARRRTAQKVEAVAAGRLGYNEHDLIFTKKDGTPIQPDAFTALFRRTTRKAGLDDAGTHILRHSWATTALEMGVHPKVVSEQLGHADVAITLSVYSHVRPAVSDEAALQIQALYG